MFIPVGCAVTAVEVKKDEKCFCDKCFFFRNDKICDEKPCIHKHRPDGKDVIFILVNMSR